MKPGNFFLTKSKIVKIGDFGLAKKLSGTNNFAVSTKIGTPNYMAPEIFCGEKYNEAVDIWALGVCLYEMLTLKRPFKKAPN